MIMLIHFDTLLSVIVIESKSIQMLENFVIDLKKLNSNIYLQEWS